MASCVLLLNCVTKAVPQQPLTRKSAPVTKSSPDPAMTLALLKMVVLKFRHFLHIQEPPFSPKAASSLSSLSLSLSPLTDISGRGLSAITTITLFDGQIVLDLPWDLLQDSSCACCVFHTIPWVSAGLLFSFVLLRLYYF